MLIKHDHVDQWFVKRRCVSIFVAPHDPRQRFLCFFIVLSPALLVRRLSQGYYVCSSCPSFSAPMRQGPAHCIHIHIYMIYIIYHISLELFHIVFGLYILTPRIRKVLRILLQILHVSYTSSIVYTSYTLEIRQLWPSSPGAGCSTHIICKPATQLATISSLHN